MNNFSTTAKHLLMVTLGLGACLSMTLDAHHSTNQFYPGDRLSEGPLSGCDS